MDRSVLEPLLAAGREWGLGLGLLGAAVVVGMLASLVLARLARRLLRRPAGRLPLQGALLRRLRGPLFLLGPALAVYAMLPATDGLLSPLVRAGVAEGLNGLFVVAATWGLLAALRAAEEAVADRYAMDVPDNLKARKIVTQVRILRRIASAIVVVLAAALVLLQYDPFRELGTGILASAGIVGIVVGIAAQNTIGDLIAGIQIALTQPIRVDDVVVVEGEFGWIEEITLTYVVVRVWDRRRIVMPITHFVETPFQNWTRTSADLIGSVFLYVDYRTPVDAVRDELRRVVEASEYWDGDVCALHVTDTRERGIELRALASAESAPQLWELRCEVRERLVAYLRDHHPDALPVVRAQVRSHGSDPSAAPSPHEG
jgi:small-conductance mechanosensitive channel